MINRREVIASGLVVSLLTRTAAASLAGAPAEASRYAPLFIAEVGFVEARAAARAASLHGASVRFLSNDITALYASLDRAWRSFPFAAAGLTTTNTLFVIERLAWDRGLRTVYRGIHRRDPGGAVEHESFGSEAAIGRLGTPGDDGWAATLGRVLVESAIAPAERPRAVQPPQALPGPNGATLASWLLVSKDAAGRHFRATQRTRSP